MSKKIILQSKNLSFKSALMYEIINVFLIQ